MHYHNHPHQHQHQTPSSSSSSSSLSCHHIIIIFVHLSYLQFTHAPHTHTHTHAHPHTPTHTHTHTHTHTNTHTPLFPSFTSVCICVHQRHNLRVLATQLNEGIQTGYPHVCRVPSCLPQAREVPTLTHALIPFTNAHAFNLTYLQLASPSLCPQNAHPHTPFITQHHFHHHPQHIHSHTHLSTHSPFHARNLFACYHTLDPFLHTYTHTHTNALNTLSTHHPMQGCPQYASSALNNLWCVPPPPVRSTTSGAPSA